jgi:hypothetical protein
MGGLHSRLREGILVEIIFMILLIVLRNIFKIFHKIPQSLS